MRKKLLVDAHVFDGKYQGTRTYIEGLYRNITHYKEFEFYFVARDVQNLKSVFGEAENIHYIPLRSKRSILRLVWDIPRIIKKYDIDYAHFQYVSPLRKYCKEIVTVHDLLFLDFPQYFPLCYRVMNKFMFRRSSIRADMLLTVSKYSRDEIIRYFNIPASQIYITPNGVSLPTNWKDFSDVREKYGLTKYLLTVGRIEPRKNHLSLLRAFIELKLYEQDYKLVMVGSLDLKAEEFFTYYNSLTAEEKSYIVMTSVEYKDLVSLYRNTSLFVFPSFAEGFGIPPIEAAALGAPVLCSRDTAMADFDFFGDMMFNPNDLEELKLKISYCLKNEMELRNKWTNYVANRYDWQIIAEKYLHMLISAM